MTIDTVEPSEVGFSAGRLARIAQAMQSYVDRGTFAGLSTLVARRGKVVHFEQVGRRDEEADLPLEPDTIFRIYSMTKPIVSVVLMTLFEEGRFQLFDPVSKFIPAFRDLEVLEVGPNAETSRVPAKREVTVRDLLTHTSGLSYAILDESPVRELYREESSILDAKTSLADAVDGLARLPLAYQPGTRWHYSVGIDVAARLVEVILGRPLGEVLYERIFEPLGMNDTGFWLPPEERDRVAVMYGVTDLAGFDMTLEERYEAWGRGERKRIDVTTSYPVDSEGFARGGHGLVSTIQDYYRFAQMMLGGGVLDGTRILGRKTLELMHTNHLPAELLPPTISQDLVLNGYGFGLGSRVLLDVAASQLPGSVGEFGWAGAATTHYWVDPGEEIVGVLMTQKLMGFDAPQADFHALTYQALDD